MTSHSLRFAVMGAGAVGGYFGARLAAAEADVAFIARGPHLAAIRDGGLHVLSPRGDVTVQPAKATDDPGEVGPVDVVLFTVKLYDTESAGRRLAPLLGESTAVVSFQNGVDAEERLGGIVGPAHVMGGAAYIPAVIERPGVIRHRDTVAKLVFGELDGRRSTRAEALLAAFQAAGVDAELSSDIVKTLWSKFVFLAALTATTAIARVPLGPILRDPDSREMFVTAMREVAAVARARGVALDADIVERQLATADRLDPGIKSSMLHDLERGKRLEIESLRGTVARFGAELGVETPIHRTAYAALKPYADDRRGEASSWATETALN